MSSWISSNCKTDKATTINLLERNVRTNLRAVQSSRQIITFPCRNLIAEWDWRCSHSCTRITGERGARNSTPPSKRQTRAPANFLWLRDPFAPFPTSEKLVGDHSYHEKSRKRFLKSMQDKWRKENVPQNDENDEDDETSGKRARDDDRWNTISVRPQGWSDVCHFSK